MSADNEINEIINQINQIRQDPVSYKKRFSTISKALARSKKTKEAHELGDYADNLSSYPKITNKLKYSDGLSKACQEEMEHQEKDGISHLVTKGLEDIQHHVDHFCKGYNKITMIYDDGEYDSMITRFFISDHDKDKEYIKALFEKDYNYIGVAYCNVEDKEKSIIIFADTVEEVNGNKLDMEKFSELKIAFDYFDIHESGKIDPKELKTALRALNYDTKNPTVWDIILSLDNKENHLGFDFTTFALAFDVTLGDDRSKDGLKRLFTLFLNDTHSETLTSNSIKRLCLEVDEKISQEEASEIINRCSLSGSELTFEEFYDILSNRVD